MEQIKLPSFIVNSSIKVELTSDERDELRLLEEKKEHELALKDYERRAKEKKKAILDVGNDHMATIELLSVVLMLTDSSFVDIHTYTYINRNMLKEGGRKRARPLKTSKS